MPTFQVTHNWIYDYKNVSPWLATRPSFSDFRPARGVYKVTIGGSFNLQIQKASVDGGRSEVTIGGCLDFQKTSVDGGRSEIYGIPSHCWPFPKIPICKDFSQVIAQYDVYEWDSHGGKISVFKDGTVEIAFYGKGYRITNALFGFLDEPPPSDNHVIKAFRKLKEQRERKITMVLNKTGKLNADLIALISKY